MESKQRYGAFAAWTVAFFLLIPGLCAQEAAVPQRVGVPQDWSQRHVVFSRNGLAQHPNLQKMEPRLQHQLLQRWQAPPAKVSATGSVAPGKRKFHKVHRDWSVALGGRVSRHMWPVKYSFDATAPPNCVNDFAVFGLNVAGVTGGKANLVGYNNLYSDPINNNGLCDPVNGGPGLSVLFAYNIGAKIVTSPILSLDGTKIGFVESLGTSAIFHVLTWSASDGGTPTVAVAPTGGEMTSLTFSPSATSTTSAPWIDYASDVAYLGNDAGQIFKITGVFHGTPALDTSGIWPVTISTNFHLTAPVLDFGRSALMVGSANGTLYKIDTTSGAVSFLVVGQSGATSPGITGPPIVDVTNGTTFVVSANDGTSAVLVEADTASMVQLSKARIGMGSSGAPGTAMSLYEPAFDNQYYSYNGTGTNNGVIRLCGTGAADTSPWQYAFGFTGRNMNASSSFSAQLLASTSIDARCTGWTEFFNPFAGASDTITGTSVTSNVLTVTTNNSDLTVGETIYIQGTAEGVLNGQAVTVASLIGPGPVFTGFTANFTTADYSNGADTGTVSAGTDFFFFGFNRECTAPGSLQTDGCVLSRSDDGTPTQVTINGGPSGIIVDNYSTAAQASSIYFSATAQNTAYKFTQNGLQ